MGLEVYPVLGGIGHNSTVIRFLLPTEHELHYKLVIHGVDIWTKCILYKIRISSVCIYVYIKFKVLYTNTIVSHKLSCQRNWNKYFYTILNDFWDHIRNSDSQNWKTFKLSLLKYLYWNESIFTIVIYCFHRKCWSK